MPLIIDNDSNVLPVTVVEPGSVDDPFTDPSLRASAPQVPASPAAPAPGTPPAPAEDGSKIVPATPVTEPTAAPAPTTAPASVTPATEPTPLELAVKEGKLEEYIAGLVKDQTGTALRSQQSGYDRRITALQEDLKAAREASLKAEREAKLNSEDLSDDEKALLRGKWELDDRQNALQEYEQAVDEHWRAVYVASLVQDYGRFGVTGDDLEQFQEPEEMDVFVRDKELEFYRSGKHVTDIPARTVAVPAPKTEPDPTVPAGAQAPTDLGGTAPAHTPTKLDESTGIDAIKHNLENLPWVTVSFN